MHIPVLLNEVIQCLNPKPGENFVDCTVGEGGHAMAILERTAPDGRVLGIDADGESLERFRMSLRGVPRAYSGRRSNLFPESLQNDLRKGFPGRISCYRNIDAARNMLHWSTLPTSLRSLAMTSAEKRLILVQGNFADIEKIVSEEHFGPVSGVLMDLGLSSWQLEESGGGFSFLKDEPLLMQLSTANPQLPTAQEIVNTWEKEELEKILREYGEERYARRIAEAIADARKGKRFYTTKDLVDVIRDAVPPQYLRGRIHPATRTFQALRIAVNDELGALQKGLAGALEIVNPGGRLVVISFHSLEDRIVKNFLREQKKLGSVEILTKKPIIPSAVEIAKNPRSRSAKLRAAIKSMKC